MKILLLAGFTLASLTAIFWATGTLFPTQLPAYATSALQITGISLMLILLPPYLLVALSISQRRSFKLIEQLRSMLPDPQAAEVASEGVRGALRRSWKIGTVIGIAFGLLNTESIRAFTQGPVPAVSGSISFGQMLLWWLIGVLLVTRITSARVFSRLGESVSFDLFHPDDLRPLARAGVIDVVIVAGALLFTPLQSLDAEFRWYNYRFAMVVALPAASFFLLWPLRGVHRRIRWDRDTRIGAVEAQLHATQTGRDDDAEAIVRRETLLAHRDRLRAARMASPHEPALAGDRQLTRGSGYAGSVVFSGHAPTFRNLSTSAALGGLPGASVGLSVGSRHERSATAYELTARGGRPVPGSPESRPLPGAGLLHEGTRPRRPG